MKLDRVLLFEFFLQDCKILHYNHKQFLNEIHHSGGVEYIKYLLYCLNSKMFYKNLYVCTSLQSSCTIGVAYNLAVLSEQVVKWDKFKFERFVYRMEKWKAASMYMDFHEKTLLRIPDDIAEDSYTDTPEIVKFFTRYPTGATFEYISRLRLKSITFINPTESRFKQYEQIVE